MFIQTENTPNPAALKFLPGCQVMESGTANFTSSDDAATRSPLAGRLFAIEGVEGVFFGDDFVSVTKADDKDWEVMKPLILGAVMEHFTAGDPVLLESSKDTANEDGDDSVAGQIKELIETRVRPAVAQDGGDIVFRGFEDGVVFLQLRGACAGCPGAAMTLKSGVENMLRHYIPEVQEVRAVE
jgi:Fe-S cluster biogenesis protein NfuA